MKKLYCLFALLLVSNNSWTSEQPPIATNQDEERCPICFEGYEDPTNSKLSLNCACSNSTFHKDCLHACLAQNIQYKQQRTCPYCRKEASIIFDPTTISFLNAVKYGEIERIRTYITDGFNINTQDCGGRTPLMATAFLNYIDEPTRIEMAHLLLNAGALLETTNHAGWNALMIAIRYNQTALVKLLIDAGANINATTIRSATTPLMSSAYHNYTDITRMLLNAGANTEIKNRAGQTALGIALAKNSTQSADLIRERMELNERLTQEEALRNNPSLLDRMRNAWNSYFNN